MKSVTRWFKAGADEVRDAFLDPEFRWAFGWMTFTVAAIFAIHKIGYALGL